MWQYSSARNSGVSILNEVLGRIKLDDDLIKENNGVLHDFLPTFLATMKEVDELFNSLYTNQPYFTGSFYSDLRISKPDEFDINLELHLPFRESEFEITHHQQEQSYVKYKLCYPSSSRHPRLTNVLFENGFLMSENVRTWFQSVIDKALRRYRRPSSCQQVCARQAGPARTIAIRKNNGAYIDVDLVPVVSCTLNLPSLDRRIAVKTGRSLKAFLVPKPPYPGSTNLWRTHFPDSEEVIIYDIGCAKSVIKLLKFLRDKEQWSILASYYLKTVVMWMIIENTERSAYWTEDKLYERFLGALQELASYVQQRNLPYIFNVNCNLIQKMSHQEAQNIYNRLNILIRNVNDDRIYLRRLF